MLGHIYMLYCRESNKSYIGKCNKPFDHAKSHWRYYLRGGGDFKRQSIVRAIHKYGACNFSVFCLEHCVTEKQLNKREMFYIKQFDTKRQGYNRTWGGDGFDAKMAREISRRRVDEGTHHWLNGTIASKNQKKRVAEGTHHLLGGRIQRENNIRRVAEGTHPWIGGEIARETQLRRMENGTHHFLNVEHQKKASRASRDRWKRKYHKSCWMYILSLARCWYEMNDYIMKRRTEFYNTDIVDTSNSEQLSLPI